ncbi:MAG: hypothetical protein ABH821_04560 [archaeon]
MPKPKKFRKAKRGNNRRKTFPEVSLTIEEQNPLNKPPQKIQELLSELANLGDAGKGRPLSKGGGKGKARRRR